MRRGLIAVLTVAFAFVGPRISAPSEKKAGEPFAYEPPAGFTPAKDAQPGTLEWSNETRPGQIVVPRLHLDRSPGRSAVETTDLDELVKGMPAMLQESGVTWKFLREETRTRADGARVGLIEGECTKTVTAQGMTKESTSSAVVRYRRLQLVFPTDDGASLLTAIYGVDEVDKWQPQLEATIGTAHGVATRLPPPPNWMYFAWGGAGLVIGLVASAVLGRGNKLQEKKQADEKQADA